MRQFNCSLFFILLLSSVWINWCQAETGILRKETSAELQADPEFKPESGTHFYDVYWKDVRVGKATITVKQDNELYQVIVRASTSSKINMFYKFRYKGEVEMESYPLKPLQTSIVEQAGRKTKEMQIEFLQEDRAEAVEVKSVDGETRTITKRSATSETFLLDPFSIVFLVRHLDWHVGMAELFDVFTGKKTYELTLICESVKTKYIGRNPRDAWVITPYTRELDSPGADVKSDLKVYVSKDEKKEILKIEGAPKIGRVEARIRKFVPQPAEE